MTQQPQPAPRPKPPKEIFIESLATNIFMKWLENHPGALMDYAKSYAKEAVFAAECLHAELTSSKERDK